MVLLLLVSVPGRPTLFSEGGRQGGLAAPLRAWRPKVWPPFAAQTALWAERPHWGLSGCATAHLFGTFSGMRKYIYLRDAKQRADKTFVVRAQRGAEPAPPTMCRLRSCDGLPKGGQWPPLRRYVSTTGYRGYVPAMAGAWGRSPHWGSLGKAGRRLPFLYDGADMFQGRGTQGRPLAAPTEGRSRDGVQAIHFSGRKGPIPEQNSRQLFF